MPVPRAAAWRSVVAIAGQDEPTGAPVAGCGWPTRRRYGSGNGLAACPVVSLAAGRRAEPPVGSAGHLGPAALAACYGWRTVRGGLAGLDRARVRACVVDESGVVVADHPAAAPCTSPGPFGPEPVEPPDQDVLAQPVGRSGLPASGADQRRTHPSLSPRACRSDHPVQRLGVVATHNRFHTCNATPRTYPSAVRASPIGAAALSTVGAVVWI